MATDYGLIGRFNQVQPGGLTQAFRGGVDLRGQMLQNQAQQFANQQAPILADRATQKWEQDLANLQANETNLLAQAQAKQQEAELKQREDAQKFYSDSGEKIGSVLAAVKRNDQIPFAFDYLEKMAQSEVIDPKAWNNIKQTIGQNVPDVGMVNYIGQTTIKAIDQISKENERLRAEQQALKEQGVQQRFEVAEAGKEERLTKTINAQGERAKSGDNIVVETDQGIVLINKKTGKVTPVKSDEGVPVIKKTNEKPMSAEASQRIALSKGFDDNLNELLTKMTKGDFRRNAASAKISGSDLDRLISDTKDQLSKLRSGAATGSLEDKTYSKLISDFGDISFDNRDAFINQINRFKKQNKYFLDALSGTTGKKSGTTPGVGVYKTKSGVPYEVIP